LGAGFIKSMQMKEKNINGQKNIKKQYERGEKERK
jgi:hypothetical protein